MWFEDQGTGTVVLGAPSLGVMPGQDSEAPRLDRCSEDKGSQTCCFPHVRGGGKARGLLFGDRGEDRSLKPPLAGRSWPTRHLLASERGARAVWWRHLLAALGSAVQPPDTS